MPYIGITQDGIGRIIFDQTDSKFEGLYTEGLETCLAIIIVGSHGISLIHNTGWLRAEDILTEFKAVGDLEYWTIAYNPKIYKNVRENEAFLNKIKLFLPKLIAEVGKSYLKNSDGLMELYSASEGAVLVNRQKKITFSTIPLTSISFPVGVKKFREGHREALNEVNNFFLNIGEFTPADMQYDGLNFTAYPTLNKSLEEVDLLCKLPKFSEFPSLPEMYSSYRTCMEFEQQVKPLLFDFQGIIEQLNAEAGWVKNNQGTYVAINSHSAQYQSPISQPNTSSKASKSKSPWKLIKQTNEKYKTCYDMLDTFYKKLITALSSSEPEQIKLKRKNNTENELKVTLSFNESEHAESAFDACKETFPDASIEKIETKFCLNLFFDFKDFQLEEKLEAIISAINIQQTQASPSNII